MTYRTQLTSLATPGPACLLIPVKCPGRQVEILQGKLPVLSPNTDKNFDALPLVFRTILGEPVLDDAGALSRLVDGLTRATKSQSLEWHKGQKRSAKTVYFAAMGGLADSRQYFATSRNAAYTLSSSDSFGVAPYELTVRELKAKSSIPTLEIESSTEPSLFPLNASLQRLFDAVEASIEPTDNIVSRLLDGL